MAVYKSGTGTWDLGTRDEGLEDIMYGTRGLVRRGREDLKQRNAGDLGTTMIIEKVVVNVISVTFLVNMF